jgi:Ca2+-transporting ATPase
VIGAVMTASSALLHVHASGDPELMLRGRALGFSYLALGALLHAYGCTSPRSVLFRLDAFRRPLTVAVLASASIHALAVAVPALRPVFKTYPLDVTDVAKLAALCLTVVPAYELWKWIVRRRGSRERQTSL